MPISCASWASHTSACGSSHAKASVAPPRNRPKPTASAGQRTFFSAFVSAGRTNCARKYSRKGNASCIDTVNESATPSDCRPAPNFSGRLRSGAWQNAIRSLRNTSPKVIARDRAMAILMSIQRRSSRCSRKGFESPPSSALGGGGTSAGWDDTGVMAEPPPSSTDAAGEGGRSWRRAVFSRKRSRSRKRKVTERAAR